MTDVGPNWGWLIMHHIVEAEYRIEVATCSSSPPCQRGTGRDDLRLRKYRAPEGPRAPQFGSAHGRAVERGALRQQDSEGETRAQWAEVLADGEY